MYALLLPTNMCFEQAYFQILPERQCTYDVTLRRVRATIAAVEKK